jgi:hypothetical protein
MGDADALGMAEAWAPDRRRADRRRVPSFLEARLEGHDAPMRVRELGRGGMVLIAPWPLLVGEPVTVAFGTGAGSIGPLRGRVAHCRVLLARRLDQPHTCLVGVSFDQVTADQSACIATLLAEIDTRPPRRCQDRS